MQRRMASAKESGGMRERGMLGGAYLMESSRSAWCAAGGLCSVCAHQEVVPGGTCCAGAASESTATQSRYAREHITPRVHPPVHLPTRVGALSTLAVVCRQARADTTCERQCRHVRRAWRDTHTRATDERNTRGWGGHVRTHPRRRQWLARRGACVQARKGNGRKRREFSRRLRDMHANFNAI